MYKQPKQEVKNFTYVYSATQVTNAGTVDWLLDIPQGTNNGERIGNKIDILGFYVKLYGVFNTTNTGVSLIRFMLIEDKQSTGTLPNISLILNTTSLPNSMPNPLYTERFRTIVDKLITLDVNQQVKSASSYRKYKTRLYYSGAAATDLAGKQLLVLILSEDAANYPTINGHIRSYYVDS